MILKQNIFDISSTQCYARSEQRYEARKIQVQDDVALTMADVRVEAFMILSAQRFFNGSNNSCRGRDGFGSKLKAV